MLFVKRNRLGKNLEVSALAPRLPAVMTEPVSERDGGERQVLGPGDEKSGSRNGRRVEYRCCR